MSMVFSSASTKVLGVRRHLRAVRRAGAKRDGEPCNDGSLWMEMAEVFKLNVLIGFLGMQLIDLDKEPLASRTLKNKVECAVEDNVDDEEEDAATIMKDVAGATDSLEYR